MTTSAFASTDSLTRDALAVLQPGFKGTTSAPDWLLRRIDEGLASVALFGRNVVGPEQLAALTGRMRAERGDLLVAIDEEGGDVTRLEVNEGSSFPGNLALGAVDDPDLTRAVAQEIGRRLAECGINLNWAPAADVNANPDNPVIGVRSFGADPALVARHTAAYVEGMQAAGVATSVKHFPGHGDTAVDSHHDLPRIDADRTVLDRRDLVPFRAAVAAGTRAVMSAHILVPALDPIRPATLSSAALHGLLRQPVADGGLGFDGLIVTDAMEMKAISATYGLEHGCVLAIAAGADAICVGGGLADEETVQRLHDALVRAVHVGELTEERLADAAARVRALGAWARLGTQHAASFVASAPRSASASASAPMSAQAMASASASGSAQSAVLASVSGSDAALASASGPTSAPAGRAAHAVPAAPEVGLTAARRAVRVTAGEQGFSPLQQSAYVAAFTPMASIAVGDDTPWGVAAELARLLPGTETEPVTKARMTRDGVPATIARVCAAAGKRPIVAVVRDVHRHHWMTEGLNALVAARPNTIVVEMGVPQAAPIGALHIATHGAARVCGRAAAEVITGGEAVR
ncbi:glycoside hydrolase family 3 protein [Streptomyces zagrosensis]|uniref:Beta-N-acetylhexosaminidase n=1 Tax=Streptomyces zagrosensis TaxID=1042984 RepID=A0A7W9V0K9_9ACTN|nr:glycoside hydrolase family 3 protein [Streptomyces zagrosensis]MBB5936869.1 beta-N-acetylhexosaminidase [Streptomyces zagrosensis]